MIILGRKTLLELLERFRSCLNISSVASNAKYAASLYHRTLKAAFNKAVVWNYLEENPFNKIKSPKVAKMERKNQNVNLRMVKKTVYRQDGMKMVKSCMKENMKMD